MLDRLHAALHAGAWREANALTRDALGRGPVAEEAIRAVDSLWVEASGSRFGFSAQAAIAKRLGLQLADLENELRPFTSLGRELGWYETKSWRCWTDADHWPSLAFVPTIAISVNIDAVPVGMLPFHDVMSFGSWRQGFLPTDCWGEGVWRRWAETWRLFGLG